MIGEFLGSWTSFVHQIFWFTDFYHSSDFSVGELARWTHLNENDIRERAFNEITENHKQLREKSKTQGRQLTRTIWQCRT